MQLADHAKEIADVAIVIPLITLFVRTPSLCYFSAPTQLFFLAHLWFSFFLAFLTRLSSQGLSLGFVMLRIEAAGEGSD